MSTRAASSDWLCGCSGFWWGPPPRNKENLLSFSPRSFQYNHMLYGLWLGQVGGWELVHWHSPRRAFFGSGSWVCWHYVRGTPSKDLGTIFTCCAHLSLGNTLDWLCHVGKVYNLCRVKSNRLAVLPVMSNLSDWRFEASEGSPLFSKCFKKKVLASYVIWLAVARKA